MASLMLMNTFGGLASAAQTTVELDLSRFKEGDVVLRGEKVDGACAYPLVSARALPAENAALLRGTDDCEIVHAGVPDVTVDLCNRATPGTFEVEDLPSTCTGTSGQPDVDLSNGCAEGRVDLHTCTAPPAAGQVGGLEGVSITASHCPSRNLNSYISSGPTTVGVGMNYREHCNAGARVNSWYSYCSWNSGQGWRLWYFSYGGGWNWDVAWRWTECAFDHGHWWGSHGYHYMGTQVNGWNYYSDSCSYWWSWNSHTNYVVYSCWYS